MMQSETMEMTVQLDGHTVIPRPSKRRDALAYELCAPPGTLRLGFRLKQPNLFAVIWFIRSDVSRVDLERGKLCEPGKEVFCEYHMEDPCMIEVSWALSAEQPRQDTFGVDEAMLRLTAQVYGKLRQVTLEWKPLAS